MCACVCPQECKVSPISLEPLFGHKAAILSVIILLPRGDEDYTLPDQCGVAIGSALVTLGLCSLQLIIVLFMAVFVFYVSLVNGINYRYM